MRDMRENKLLHGDEKKVSDMLEVERSRFLVYVGRVLVILSV